MTSKKSGKVTFGASKSWEPAASSTRISKDFERGPSSSKTVSQTRKKPAFTMPALSVPPKQPPVDPALEKLKKKTVRRNAPEGEDLKKIKEIVKGTNGEVVTVQEYVGLVAPYTGDNGNILRSVMAEDLSSFRKMAKRVYDTMTGDVSDVLANEQIHLAEYYTEREKLFVAKTMRALNDIYQLAPDFDFRRYHEDPEYLDKLFPVSPDLNLDPEEEEMHRRQEAYHRLQWLRSEGVRLNEENDKLQGRLKQLKRQQQTQQMQVQERGELAESHKARLEAVQEELEDRLQELNKSVEKSLICNEEELRLKDENELEAREASIKSAKLKRSRTKLKKSSEGWNVETAKGIEFMTHARTTESTVAGVSMVSVASKTGAIKKIAKPSKVKRTKRKVPPEHSPSRTPPRQTSPFHYSPPRTPPGIPISSFGHPHGDPPPETVRIESSTTIIEETPQTRQLPPARRSLAPRDAWGGFY